MAIHQHMLQYAQSAAVATSNLNDVLALIKAVTDKLNSDEMTADFMQTICTVILKKMTEVPVPREAENIQQQDALVVAEFFQNLNHRGDYQNLVPYVLTTVYESITREQEVSPLISLGLAVIPDTLIGGAVSHIFNLNRSLHNQRRAIINAVKRLITWQKTTRYSVPLHLWIVKVLSTLHEEKQYDTLEEIIFENIVPCYLTLIVPIFQARTFTVVQAMLEFQHSEKIFNGKLFISS